MKKHIKKFTHFSKRIGRGLNIELKETVAIPSLLRRGEYRKAGEQVLDIVRMAGLTIVWIVPGGAILTTMILKFSDKSRPSAFRQEETEEDESSKKEEEP